MFVRNSNSTFYIEDVLSVFSVVSLLYAGAGMFLVK